MPHWFVAGNTGEAQPAKSLGDFYSDGSFINASAIVEIRLGPGPCLMYHFRGFALIVRLEYSREGVTPEIFRKRVSADERLPGRELLRIDSHSRPFVKIDGIGSREERMRQYNARLDAALEKIEMDSKRSTRKS